MAATRRPASRTPSSTCARTVTDLDPNRADLTGVKKVLKWLPGGDKIDRYFAKYQSAQSHLNAIIKALDSGQDELRKDNAAIETEKANMWTLMGKLREYNELAAALDAGARAEGRRARGGGPNRGRERASDPTRCSRCVSGGRTS